MDLGSGAIPTENSSWNGAVVQQRLLPQDPTVMVSESLTQYVKEKSMCRDFGASIKKAQMHAHHSVKFNHVCSVQTQTRTL